MKPAAAKRRAQPSDTVYSSPTMCLHCHLVVELVLTPSGEVWNCPRCKSPYPVKWWKIKKGGRRALDHRPDPE